MYIVGLNVIFFVVSLPLFNLELRSFQINQERTPNMD